MLVARELDRLVGLERHELERPGADRVGAHLRRRDVARIDRRHAGCQQRQEGGLRPLEVEDRASVALDRDAVEVLVPGLAGIDAQLGGGLADQHLPRALHVFGGERLAVVPGHALAEREGEGGALGVPRPLGGELGHDALQAVLGHVLLVDHQVVEDRHPGCDGRDSRLLVDRQARRAVAVEHLEHAAAFLGQRWIRGPQQRQHGRNAHEYNPHPDSSLTRHHARARCRRQAQRPVALVQSLRSLMASAARTSVTNSTFCSVIAIKASKR